MEDNKQKKIQFAPDSRSRRRRKIKQELKIYPTHTVQQQWKEYWRGMKEEREVRRGVRRAPYGTHVGYQKKWDEDRKQFYPRGRAKQLPIQGPPNWDQFWNQWPDIGTDHSEQPANPNLCPLSPRQLENLDMNSYIFTNIQFFNNLANGAYGSVWRVICTRRNDGLGAPQQQLACKVIKAITGAINPDQMTMLNGMRLLVQDINACMGLNHENIVKYLDVITIPDERTRFPYSTILILMPLCRGDLFNILEIFGLITMDICLRLMDHMTRAVRYLHDLNIVHLDIKPENILFEFEDPATPLMPQTIIDNAATMIYKLTDFGCARMHLDHELQRTTLLAGSPEYAAPEMLQVQQYWPEGVLTKPCDIYSLGATIISSMVHPQTYETYRTQSYLDELMAHLHHNEGSRRNVAPHMTADLAAFLFKLVRRDPINRSTIRDIWTALNLQPPITNGT